MSKGRWSRGGERLNQPGGRSRVGWTALNESEKEKRGVALIVVRVSQGNATKDRRQWKGGE